MFNSQIKYIFVFCGTGGNLSIKKNDDSHDVAEISHTLHCLQKATALARVLGAAEVSRSKPVDLDWIQTLLEDFIVNITRNITACCRWFLSLLNDLVSILSRQKSSV